MFDTRYFSGCFCYSESCCEGLDSNKPPQEHFKTAGREAQLPDIL